MPQHALMALKGTEDILAITAEANDKTAGFVQQWKHTAEGFVHRMGPTLEDCEEQAWTSFPLDDDAAIQKYTRSDNIKNNLDHNTGIADPEER